MDYMAKHGMKRARPAELVAGTRRVISARLAYLPAESLAPDAAESEPGALALHDWRAREQAGSTIRRRPSCRSMRAAATITRCCATACRRSPSASSRRSARSATACSPIRRPCSRSSRAEGRRRLARQAHAAAAARCGAAVLPRRDLRRRSAADRRAHVPDTAPETPGAHCGSCTRCIDACPTGAIVEPYRVDARRCISYLTIELKGSIPEPLRPMIGNRVYGCDDCQLVCPWNKFAQAAPVADFDVRHGLDRATLVELFAWDADAFDTRMQGSAIRRIGYESWLRNLAVGRQCAARGRRPAHAAGARRDRRRVARAGRRPVAGRARACRMGAACRVKAA